jgi:hypothetical protein
MARLARSRWILLLIVVGVIAGVWLSRRKPPHYSVAYVAGRGVTLWNTTAQIRQPLATLSYGDRLLVVHHAGGQVEIRTAAGTQGWINADLLMDGALWEMKESLLTRAQAMPVQARGHTNTISNVHVEPGRAAARIFQFGRNVPVVVLQRSVEPALQEGAASSGGAGPKMEDWLFVMRTQPTAGELAALPRSSPVSTQVAAASQTGGADIAIAGWVLGRFVALDPPSPIPDYASSAAMRVVAWAALDRIPSPEGDRPQYLVAGTRDGEGEPCDFTMLRVYTWSKARRQYETAYLENGLCGRLPIRVDAVSGGAQFRFAELGGNGAERVYRLRQTLVRRVREGETKLAKGRR